MIIEGSHTDADLVLIGAVLARWPGARIVDVRPASKGAPAAAAATPGVTWSAVIGTVLAEADRIRIGQEHLVKAGLARAPDAGKIKAAECFEAVARLVELCRDDPVIVARLRELKGRAE